MEKLLLQIIDQGYQRKAWHGPNLKGALRGVRAADAAWRPARGRHNIWELTLHAAYWKHAVRRQLAGGRRGSFPIKGSNWFECPVNLTEEGWRRDRALLDKAHQQLREAVAGLKNVENPAVSSLVYGVAFHDVYHAGQIQMLKRLRAAAPP